jgi:hypothetical protein
MFKKFIKKILSCESKENALQNVFYGENGIDVAFQRDKISWDEHQMLLGIIEKMA